MPTATLKQAANPDRVGEEQAVAHAVARSAPPVLRADALPDCRGTSRGGVVPAPTGADAGTVLKRAPIISKTAELRT